MCLRINLEPIRISRTKLSEAAWESLFDHSAAYARTELETLLRNSLSLEKLRGQANYNTGSISTAAIWSIFSACLYFQPKMVAEVGTFIGKSTLAVASAMDLCRHEVLGVFTCDFSNNISLNLNTRTPITQFPLQSSTVMFSEMQKNDIRCDVLVLDGRLQEEDFGLLPSVLHDRSVILLDDFEGTEKGCVNAMYLMQSLEKKYHLIYPPSRQALERRGLMDGCTLAMIVPKSLVTFTHQ
jgi:hypothetical protein